MHSSLDRQRPIHFIGAGGIGMSALALILAQRGFCISGSDPSNNENIQNLIDEGVKVFQKQSPSNIKTICFRRTKQPLIVISSAIPKNNPELTAAKAAGLEIWHRSDLLAALIKSQPSIAIAGSHGKTTTSTFITTFLAIANRDPTSLIGGCVPFYGRNAHAGTGELLIAEADESDGSLIKFEPKIGIITNLELDHTDHYASLNELINTMQIFAKKCNQLLVNYDCKILRNNFKSTASWSTKNKSVDFAAIPIKLDGRQTIASIYERGSFIDNITMPIPGLHNLSNIIASIGACRMAGLSYSDIKKSINSLEAPRRRFDYRGSWNGRLIVDDYAHHPSEIKATIAMAKLMIESDRSPFSTRPKRLLIVFQPHRYSRTKEFIKAFATALSSADSLLLAPIYGAGEKPIDGASTEALANTIQEIRGDLPICVSRNLNDLSRLVKEKSKRGDLVLTIGAGDINSLWGRLIKEDKNNQLTSFLAA